MLRKLYPVLATAGGAVGLVAFAFAIGPLLTGEGITSCTKAYAASPQEDGHAKTAVAAATASGASLRSIGALEVGPDGVLFVSDPKGAAVYAFELGAAAKRSRPLEPIQDLDRKIGSLLGVDARDVYVQDMVVEEASGAIYLSVQRGNGDDARPALLSVDGAGEIALVDLAKARHSRLPLGDAPAEDAKLYRWESRTFTVTDLEYIDGELFIAGLSNEEFASVLRRVPFPFGEEIVSTGLEIYHGAHGAWETFAPIFSFVPYEIDGKPHLLAGYLCTPLVTFPLEEIRQKSRLRGKTIAELGWGNLPTDILPYEVGGKGYVLIANNTRGTLKLAASDILAAAEGEGITTAAGPREGVDYHTTPLGPVAQLANLDSDNILILGRSLDNGSLYLSSRAKRRI